MSFTTPQIKVGDTIPYYEVKETSSTETTPLIFKGKNLIVGVPAAFAGACHLQVPEYIKSYEEFKAKGINEIFVVAVNDTFVTKAWKENMAPNGSDIRIIADDKGSFTSSLGLLWDSSAALGNARSKRYVIVTDDDKVASIEIEDDPFALTVTAAEYTLSHL